LQAEGASHGFPYRYVLYLIYFKRGTDEFIYIKTV